MKLKNELPYQEKQILMAAFAHVLGGPSAAVDAVATRLIEVQDRLNKLTLHMVIDKINAQEKQPDGLGICSCDRIQWELVRDSFRKELEARRAKQ